MNKNHLKILREFDTEWIVLGTMLVVSVFMFWIAGRYSPSSAEFPRITSGIVIVFGAVVIVSKVIGFRLPGEESTRLGSAEKLEALDEIETDESEEQWIENDSDEPQTLEEYADDVRKITILSALVLIYMGGILTVGLVLSSFLFVFLYTVVWKRMRWYEVAILIGATAVILWMFQTQLNVELNRTYFDTGWREFVEAFMHQIPVIVFEMFEEPLQQSQNLIREVIN